MAFNPASFETQYGFSLADELHNFFPELMYDDTLFPQPDMMWIRSRMRTLFPHVYPRQQSIYHIYSAEGRRAEVRRWRDSTTPIRAPESVQMGATPVVQENRSRVQASPVRIDVDISGAPSRTLQRDYVPQSIFTSLILDLAPNLVDGGGFNSVTADRVNNFFDQGFLNLGLQDVVIRPSEGQLAAGSRIEQHESIPEAVDCAICQEHGQAQRWRILNCGHRFHQTCVDNWFRINFRCPICRHDIRTAPPASALASAT